MRNIKITLSVLSIGVVSSCVIAPAALGHEWLIENVELKNRFPTSEEFKATSRGGALEVPVAGTMVGVGCNADTSSPVAGRSKIEEMGKMMIELELTNCSTTRTENGVTTDLPECKISEPFDLRAEGKIEGAGEIKLTGSVPMAVEEFGKILIVKKANCVLSQTEAFERKLKGTIWCTVVAASTPVRFKEILCTPGGSMLRAGAEVVKLWTNEAIEMAGNKEPWSFI